MTEKDDAPFESRTIAGRYRIDELVGHGQFAQVFRGFDLQRLETVAVKIVSSSLLRSVDAFVADVQRSSTLKHPGIVPVRDLGQEDGNCFVVSDFVEGGSLREFVGRSILSPGQMVRWLSDVAEALEYAHSKGVVHQNLKPSNILIDRDGRALLADFGGSPYVETHQTASTVFDAGRYLSPEQIEGKSVDGRSDIYSLAVVLHELLTGHLPYRNHGGKELRSATVRDVHVDLLELPAPIRRICQKALHRAPDDRYASVSQFDADLRRTSVVSSKRRLLILAIGVPIFVVGFWISSWLTSERIIPPEVIARIEKDWSARIASLPAKEQVAVISSRLADLNPGFNGELKETIEDGVVVELELITDDVTDISPVRVLTGLKSLSCFGTLAEKSNGKLSNLLVLKGMRLTKLLINDNEKIEDLSPLEGMPLEFLHCGKTNVADLSPLMGMPLTVLKCGSTRVTNLSPLTGMSLKELYCDHTGVVDLSPLEGMPLEELHCQITPLVNLESLSGSPLKVLDCHRTLVADLTPIRGLMNLVSLNVLSTRVEDFSPINKLPKLKLLWCDFDEKRDSENLRMLTTLEYINDNPVSLTWQAIDRARP